jgi:hypothetical protein
MAFMLLLLLVVVVVVVWEETVWKVNVEGGRKKHMAPAFYVQMLAERE